MTLMALSLFGFQTAFANDVVVSNSTVTGQDALNHVAFVQFDITWDNSFRDVINHDACWVFVKYSTDGGAPPGGMPRLLPQGIPNPPVLK